jgi:hypothetical protein
LKTFLYLISWMICIGSFITNKAFAHIDWSGSETSHRSGECHWFGLTKQCRQSNNNNFPSVVFLQVNNTSEPLLFYVVCRCASVREVREAQRPPTSENFVFLNRKIVLFWRRIASSWVFMAEDMKFPVS